MIRLTVQGGFSSAHFLRNYNGKCERLHGHNWKVQIEVSGNSTDSQGLLMDFTFLKQELNKVLETLDHKVLNEDVEFFQKNNPTAENICRYIFENLKCSLNNNNCKLTAVTVYETESSSCKLEIE